MNTIVIFGATGYTGLCAVQAAINKGLKVRAFVRDVSKLPDDLKSNVEVVVGNVLNYNDVLSGVKGVDGVTVILGTRNDLSPTTDMSDGLKNIMKAMKECNINVISVCLSAFIFWDDDKVPSRFNDLHADHKRMFDAVKASGLKYIACLPPHIADQPAGDYKIQYDSSPGRIVSKHDLGRFLVESLSQPEHYEKVCGICTIPKA
ncbi:uncharacterized protein CBL_08076 [Carabus blaptoides fortunei]